MDNGRAFLGHLGTIMGWMFAMVNPSVIPIVLSSIASVMACINYYFSIKKNRDNE